MSHIKLGFHMSVVSQPLNIAVLTISDTRTLENDKSGDYLKEALTSVGHNLYDRDLVKDDIYQQRAVVSKWIADKNIHAVLITCLLYTSPSPRDS